MKTNRELLYFYFATTTYRRRILDGSLVLDLAMKRIKGDLMEVLIILGLAIVFFLWGMHKYQKAEDASNFEAAKTTMDLISRVTTLEREKTYQATLISSLQSRMQEINTQCLENEATIDETQDHLSRITDQQHLFNGKIVPQKLEVNFTSKVPVDILEMNPKVPQTQGRVANKRMVVAKKVFKKVKKQIKDLR